jgi:hypothetical protein
VSAVLCRFWVGDDTTGHACGKPVAESKGGYALCDRHYEIEMRRTAKRLENERASRARAEAAWLKRNAHRLPAWRSQLERAVAEYERRTASPVTDRAAVGGATHPSIARKQRTHFSAANVARVGELDRIIQKLRADIARAERGAE